MRANRQRLAEPVSEALYARILDGFSISPDVAMKVLRFLRHADLV